MQGLRSVDRVVAPTAWMLDALESCYGPLLSTEVIANGRGPDTFGPGEKSPFVLCAGRLWDEAKNTVLVARVARRVPWPVKIAGASSLGGNGGSDIAWPGGSGAELLGRLPPAQLADLYARAAVYVSPARYEPFGLSVLEAALSECALVLGDIPSLRELWEGAALFVTPDDEEALETALVTLMNQPELTALLAARARRRALGYSATRMVKRYLALYRNVTALAAAARPLPEASRSCVS
jgi:glycosyltransferase involved in cell wall biosynthesis